MKTLIPCDSYAENTTRKKQKSGASCLGKPGWKPRLFAVEGFGPLGEKDVEINFEKRLKGGRLE